MFEISVFERTRVNCVIREILFFGYQCLREREPIVLLERYYF